MGLLVDGKWQDEWYKPDSKGRFVRPETSFRDWIRADGSGVAPPQAGRYHLYVSYACPWATRVLIMRNLKGLQDAIGVSVVHPDMGDQGWTFADYPGATGDTLGDRSYLHQVYTDAIADITSRVTVPVLWDTNGSRIINNESREIVRMFDHEFAGIATNDADLAPAELLDQVEETIDRIYEPINNGVYRCGFAGSQEAYDEAVDELFAELDHWEQVLANQRYVCGNRLTEADVCMFTTLYRFDAVYNIHFKCSRRRIIDYPNLWAYVRDLYQMPAFADACNMDHIRRHYFWSHTSINPKRIIASMPDLEFDAPHDRDRFTP